MWGGHLWASVGVSGQGGYLPKTKLCLFLSYVASAGRRSFWGCEMRGRGRFVLLLGPDCPDLTSSEYNLM
jgi:hypothetical protein